MRCNVALESERTAGSLGGILVGVEADAAGGGTEGAGGSTRCAEAVTGASQTYLAGGRVAACWTNRAYLAH